MTTTAPVARSDEHLMPGRGTAELLLAARPAEVRRVRSHVAATALAGVEAAVARDVLLVLSELVSNAVAASPPDQHVRVAVTARRDDVTVIVENEGRVDTQTLSFELPPGGDLSGRGLAVVRALTSEFELVSNAGVIRARAIIAR